MDERDTGVALRRGLAGRCPACGEGALFSRYLKVAPTCPHCGEDLSHQRADDGPAYVTILIVGHIIGVALHLFWAAFPPIVVATGMSVAAVALSLILLPRIKGAIVGFQWARRMHGFGEGEAAVD